MSDLTLRPRPSSALTEDERMRRIGAFVCRVVRLAPALPPSVPPPVAIAMDASPDARVLAYLGTVREASPVEIRLTLGLSRSMTYRALQRLVLFGQVATRGSTKSVVYRAVVSDPTRN